MIKISGLDKLSKKIDEMAEFAKELDGDICKVSFDPDDPSSIDRAVVAMESAIDAKAATYRSNDWIDNVVTKAKESFRARILEKAAEARTKRED
jgi:hypothetical protein